jgi:hypothetical protein
MSIKQRGGLAMRIVMCLAVLGFVLAPVAAGQSAGTGAIQGTVKDPSGATVPGAEITVKNVNTGAERRITSTEAGFFSAPYLQPGQYEVRAKKAGFAEVVIQALRLEVGQTLPVDVALPLKATQETVTVISIAPIVDTEKTDVSQIINSNQVENLPLNGRRWDSLALLTPGAGEDGGFGGVSFRGINSLYNNNMVDGADNNQAFFSEARGRTRIAYSYSMNAIKEFQVQTGVYSAEYGRAAGGIVNAVTKSGANTMHGDFFYFIRDKAFIAQDPIAKSTGLAKPNERRQQFGGSFSGAAVKDKFFYYLNYDEQKRNFPAVITPFTANFFDATVATSQAARCTDINCPQALTALGLITNTINPRRGDNYLGLGKVDFHVNANNMVSGVFNILRWTSPNGILTGPVLTSTALSNGSDIVKNEFVTVTWNSVIHPTLVNEARFQYGRDFEAQTPNASGPQIQITDAANFGMPNFLPRGAFPDERRLQWIDNVSWVRGAHTVKFGMDINLVKERIQNLFQGGGIYSYQNTGTTGAGGALNKLVQDLSTGSKQYSSFVQNVDPITGSGKGNFNTMDYNFYVQDNWKVKPNFTMYLGVRYEMQKMPGIAQAHPSVPATAILNTDTNNFGPRVGFSWAFGRNNSNVLRSGYGLYYGRTQNSSIFVHLFQNGVFQQSFRFTPTSPAPAATCTPVAPNVVFPQPSTAPAFTPIYGGSGATPTAMFASLSAFLTACPAAAAGSSVVDVLDPDFVNPSVHQYDIAYERELPWQMGLTVSYLGARGNRLPVWVDANLPKPDTTKTYVVLNSGNLPTGQNVTVPFFSGAVPRLNPSVGVILMGKSVLNSWYNGLVIRVHRRESRGFSFDANFTYSTARDNGQVAGVNGTFAGTNSPLNPYDLQSEYGASDLDIRKRFIMNVVWALPFANWTDNAGLKMVVGGWKVSGIWRAQDGRHVETDMTSRPTCANGNGGLTCGAISGNGAAINGRAPLIERNATYITPAFIDHDLRISREFSITERARVEFLAEAFNIFNRTNYVASSGINAVDTGAFSFSAGSASPTATCKNSFGTGIPDFNGCLVPRTTFLALRSTGNSLYGARQLQFGMKFRF